MPTMASITVKKADGTTDIVFDSISAAGGDTSPAVWRQDTGNTAGLPVGLRSMVKLTSKWNGPKSARQVAYEAVFPYAVLSNDTGLYSARDRVVATGIITMPQGIPATQLAEAAAQIPNLIASALFKSAFAAGYSPT
jgi:hypothetical protein